MVEYLANSVRAYGFGYSEANALARMAAHARHDSGDGTLEVTLVQYETDADVAVGITGYDVDGEVQSEQTFEIPDEKLAEIADLADDLELLVEDVLVNAEEVDD